MELIASVQMGRSCFLVKNKPQSQYPTLLQSLVLVAATMVLQIALSAVLGLLWNGVGFPSVVNGISFGAVIAIAASRAKLRILEELGQRIPVLLLAAVIVSVLGLQILLSELDNAFRLLLPMPTDIAAVFDRVLARSNVLGAVILLVVVAPLTEETLFRRIILRGFLHNYSAPTAVLLSSLLFAVLHLNPWQFLGAFVLGMYFSWLYAKTHSLLLCIFGHAANNGVPLAVVHLSASRIPGYTTPFSEPAVFHPAWLNLLGVFFLITGVGLTFACLTDNLPRQHE